MKPSNMFVVPLKLQGLAEVEDVIECFRGWSDVPDAEALLKAVMHETGSEEVTFTSPPPWKDIYPPKGFIEAISGALDRVQAETIHYYGLADETILRCLCSRDRDNVSVTDMAGWWGAEAGPWDIDVAAPNPLSRLPPELSNVSFYHEGAPRKFQALIQDMRIADGDQLLLHRRMTGGPHCVAYLGAAIEQCHHTGDYEWQEGLDYVIGIWKGHSGAKQ